LVNALPRDSYQPFLCATRREGPLAALIAPDVPLLSLRRAGRFDLRALRQLMAFIRAHNIRLLHAHGTSLFTAVAASFFAPHPAVLWHDHFGRYAVEERPVTLYRALIRRVQGVIAVNQPLANWARNRLHVPATQVWYIPNFVPAVAQQPLPESLPGVPGARIVCVANLRPEKDHLTLLRALAQVIKEFPQAHLLLAGATSDPAYLARIQAERDRLALAEHLSILGSREDVAAILQHCDIGVLSSASEGLPLALLEYGMAGLPVVVTCVGQCPEVVDEGRAGILVPPGDTADLADALRTLLRSPQRRSLLGEQLRRRVQRHYSAEAVVHQVCAVYDAILGGKSPAGQTAITNEPMPIITGENRPQ
ncbi:MAG TPA: glycosyltransferase family 4 protein, partial [Armatimonadota bacterium]|nr:glycosyltransferase family 4 protein [Armatimonadota bacterium]